MSFGLLTPTRDVFAGTSSCSPISKMPAGSLYTLARSTSAHVMTAADPDFETSGIGSGVLSRLHLRATMGPLHAAYAYVERVPACLLASVAACCSGNDGGRDGSPQQVTEPHRNSAAVARLAAIGASGCGPAADRARLTRSLL